LSTISAVVFGSLNYDLIAKTGTFPLDGESVIGQNFYTSAGGKGGNQAVALSRLGIETYMVCRIGDDYYGEQLLDSLSLFGVDVSMVGIEKNMNSGIAHISVSDNGQNKIIIIRGANATCSDLEIQKIKTTLDNGVDALLLQMELPLEISLKAAQYAQLKNKLVVMDPAPAGKIPLDAYKTFDYLIPNETEAESLVGHTVQTKEEAMDAAKTLFERGVKQGVIIKLGDKGACYLNKEVSGFTQAPQVQAIDTVAAGDAFNAGFTAFLLQGQTFEKSVQMGVSSGSLAVTKSGAQESMPTLKELEYFLDSGKY
jgi:ribokinase